MSADIDRSPLSASELLLAPEHVMLRDGPARDFGVVVADGMFRDIGPLADVLQRHPQLQPLKLPASS
jgi:hypothetical protein